MIKAKDAIRVARNLIGTPYAQLDCINLIKKVIRTSKGGVKDYTTAGTNTLWRSYDSSAKYRDLTWRQTGVQGAEAGMLAFKAKGDDYHHIGIVTESGTIIHSSSAQGGRGVVETPLSSAEGWTHLAVHRYIKPGADAAEEPQAAHLYTAVVTLEDEDSWLNVRNAPSGDVIGKLYDGATVRIMAEMDEWAFVSYGEGKSGYVSVKFIKPKSEEEPVEEEPEDEAVHVQLVMTDSAGNTWIPVGDFRAELRAVMD